MTTIQRSNRQYTGKETLLYLKNQVPVYALGTEISSSLASDYGFLWTIQDSQSQITSGQALDRLATYDYDIEIVNKDDSKIYNQNTKFVIRIYPNRYKNLSIRCDEYFKILINNRAINTNYHSAFNPAFGISSSTWDKTALPGGDKKVWKKPELGKVPLIKNVYNNLNQQIPIYIKYNLNYGVNAFVQGNYSYVLGGLDGDTGSKGYSDSFYKHGISQILKKSPSILASSDVQTQGIQMYVNSITEKKSSFNIAEYWRINSLNYLFLNSLLILDRCQENSYNRYYQFADGLFTRGRGAEGLKDFGVFLSKKYGINFSTDYRRLGIDDPNYTINNKYGTKQQRAVSSPCGVNQLCWRWKEDNSVGFLDFWTHVDEKMFFSSYDNANSYVSRDVEEIEYWEVELVDPTELLSNTPPTAISPSQTPRPIQKSPVSQPDQTVNALLSSSVVPFDGRGMIPFNNYNSITSTTYTIQKFNNSANRITIYDQNNLRWDRLIGTDPAQLIIKSSPTIVNNQQYNINTIGLSYNLEDSVKLGGTDDSLLIKQGISRFSTGSRVEVNGLTLSPTTTDPNGTYIKYTNSNGTTSAITLQFLLNNTYIHHVARYKEYSTAKNKMVEKELIVLSNTKPNINILPSYLDQTLISKTGLTVNSKTFTVGIRRGSLFGPNPFHYASLINDDSLNEAARFLGAGVGDTVKLTMFPVGLANYIIAPNFNNSYTNLDRNQNEIRSDRIYPNVYDSLWYVDMEILKPNLSNNTTIIPVTPVKVDFAISSINPTPTRTPNSTPTNTPSITPTNTNTPTNSRTPTTSLSSTPQATITPTFTRTPSGTPTNTPTTTITASITPTTTPTPTRINRSNDPFFDNVSLLLYAEGQSTTTSGLIDYSKYRHSPTLVKYASISNYQSASVQRPSFSFDYGSYIEVTPLDTNIFRFGDNNFTVEAYIFLNSTAYANSGNGTFLLTTSGSLTAFNFSVSVKGGLEYWNGSVNRSMSSNNAIPLATWKHVAFSRENGTLRSFIDGVLVSSITDNTNLSTRSQMYIGSNPYYATQPCYLDGIRITNGVARYNSNFTPPTFPDIESIVATPLPTLTATPTLSITASITASPTPTPTSTATLTATGTPTVTPTNTSTGTQTPTATKTQTPSITASATITSTPTQTNTQTPTTTNTLTPTPTTTPSLSPTSTITITPTSTLTRTATPTSTVTPTPSATRAATAYAENINGVLSNVATNPTFINLTNGRNRLTGSITSGVTDYLRFSINSGLQLDNMVLVSYTAAPSASNSMILKLGSAWNSSDNTVAADTINSSKVGSSLLSITNNASLTQTNYSLAIDGDSSSYAIDMYINIIPPTQTPTNTCTPTPTSTITLTPTNTSTTTLTPTPTTTTTTTATSSLTPTPTPTNTTTLTSTPTVTPTNTATPTVTSTVTCSATVTPSNTASVTPTPSQNILINNSAQQIVQWGLGSTTAPAVTSNVITATNNCDCKCK